MKLWIELNSKWKISRAPRTVHLSLNMLIKARIQICYSETQKHNAHFVGPWRFSIDHYSSARIDLKLHLFLAMPYGMLPVLEIDGKPIAQSNAVARYLAREHNLTGSDEWEAMLCDVLVDTLGDLKQCKWLEWLYWVVIQGRHTIGGVIEKRVVLGECRGHGWSNYYD